MLNKVQLIGNLGKDPEIKYTQAGAAWCVFTVATSKTWTDQSGKKQEKVEWHNITVWSRGQNGKQAENCAKYLAKGKKVYVEGELETRSWVDERSGEKRYATSITAHDVKFLSPMETANQQSYGQPSEPQQYRGNGSSQLANIKIPDFQPDPMGNIQMPDFDSIPF